MADLSKFEEMLERLINEDREGAEELFHDIVVEKSRSIYESLLEDDEEVEETDDEDVEESDDEDEDDDDSVEEGFDLDEFEVEADDEFGGDPTDDMMGDLGMDDGEEGEIDMDVDMGDEEGGEVEDRVEDLEDALEQLKAEFEQLMSGEGDDEEGEDDEFGADDEEGEDDEEETEEEGYTFEDEEEDDVEEGSYKKKDKKESSKSSGEEMREYVEKVSGAKMGDDGTNKQSTVAKPNKMGDGTTANIARADTENGVEANKGKLKGSALNDQTAKEENAGNINVPGGKASKAQSKVSGGHGTEKKGAADKPADKSSLIGSKKK